MILILRQIDPQYTLKEPIEKATSGNVPIANSTLSLSEGIKIFKINKNKIKNHIPFKEVKNDLKLTFDKSIKKTLNINSKPPMMKVVSYVGYE